VVAVHHTNTPVHPSHSATSELTRFGVSKHLVMSAPKHLYETFVPATPDEVWAAITRPEFTTRYFFGTAFDATSERAHTIGT
jgi:hypothetical protein